MLAMRTLVSASLVVGVVGSARAQVAPDPPASDGSGAPLLPPSAVAPTPPPPKPQPTGTFQIGASYRSDEGFGINLGVGQSDLFHTGNALSLDASLDERVQHFGMKFIDPHLANNRLTLTAEVYNDRRLLGDTGIWRQAAGADVSLSTLVADHTRAFVGYRFENVENTGNLAWLRAGTSYNTLNTAMAPTRGTSAGVTVGVAADALGSDYDLMRIDAWFNTHHAFGPFIVHTGGRFAAVDGPNGVPFTEQLFFNGSSDIRGFGFGDGPGAYSPGNVLGMWRTELELPVIAGVSVRGFWDAGGILDSSGAGTIAQSLGGGLLWRSPIGPISVDYAIPFVGQGPRWLFAIGQTF
jgi:outer membrane protein insertion porin family